MATGTNAAETFQQFLTTGDIAIDIPGLIIALLGSAFLSYLLGKLYAVYGTSLSNRRKFADNFVLIALATTLVISFVKSSLALSLGLVGALSIVRFRAAIKEPEELTFLFICIAIGLGMGANQIAVTVVSFIIVAAIVWTRHFYHKKEENQNLYISIAGNASEKVSLENITAILEKHCTAVQMRRFDHTGDDGLDATFLVDIDSFKQLESVRAELKKLSKGLSVTYMDRIDVH